MLLPVSVTPVSEKVVPAAAVVAVSHVVPSSSDTCTTSPAPSGPLNVPEMVWVATSVMKSVELDPVSAENATAVTCASKLIETSFSPVPVSERSS